MEDTGYISCPSDVALIDGVGEALARMTEAHLFIVVVTNQSGIGRGYFSENDYRAVHQELLRQLAHYGAHIHATYYCPAAPPNDHPWRKPAPGMLLTAAQQHQLSLPASIMIGDKASDLQAGRRAGCRHTALVRTGQGAATEQSLCDDNAPTHIFDTLPSATDWVLEVLARKPVP